MDEPTILDPISTSKIEDLVDELKKDYTIVMVTHNMRKHLVYLIVQLSSIKEELLSKI